MNWTKFSRAAGILACLIAGSQVGLAAFAHAGSVSNGPEGGVVYDVLVDSNAPGVIYAPTPERIYRSADNGQSWARLPYGIKSDLASSVVSTDRASYAVGLDCVSLYRSRDHGQTWEPTGYVASDYRCISALAALWPSGRLLMGKESGELLASDDDGATFYLSMSGLPPADPSAPGVNMLAASPDQPGLVLAVAKQKTYRSTDAGAIWSLVDPSIANPAGQIRFGTNGVVYRSGLGAYLSRSNDGGISWTVCSSLPTTNPSIVVDAQAGNTLYFIDDESGHPYVSNDNCATATDISTGFSLDGQAKPYAMGVAVSPLTGAVLLATDVGIYQRHAGQWLPLDDGLRALQIRSFWADPGPGGQVLAGVADGFYTSPGVFRSSDGGANWTTANHGLFAADIRALVADPTTASSPATEVIYAAGTASWDDDATTHAGLWRSNDGGASWGAIEVGIPSGSFGPYLNVVRALVLDPRSCSMPPLAPQPCVQGPLQTIYAISDGDWSSGYHSDHYRVIKSQDGGAHWIDIDGLPTSIAGSGGSAVTPIVLLVDPENPQTLYIGTSYSMNGSVSSIESGVFRSDDAGVSWSLMSAGLPLAPGSTKTHESVYALALDQSHPATLWAATIATYNAGLNTSRVYKSIDAGASWVESDAGITAGDIRQIVVDDRTTPPTLYAAALGVGLYRSVNGGATWRSMSVGLPEAGASAVALDPLNPARLYVGTPRGAYVIDQQLDADEDGVPDEVEQGGPGNGDANGDGIADSQQANVSTLDLGSAGFVAIEVTPDAFGTCGQIVDAQRIDPADRVLDVDRGVTYDHVVPAIRFEVLDCPAATVRLAYSTSALSGSSGLRFFGPSTPAYSDLRWRSISADSPYPATWELHLVAGQHGSWRSEEAGSILFEGGPANSERIFFDGFDG